MAALASGGPATATDLAGCLPITRQAIAKHLALLTQADLAGQPARRPSCADGGCHDPSQAPL
ncbi:MAG: helix-turn-helix domain-containing protein [Streptosporangiaceae bacterium]